MSRNLLGGVRSRCLKGGEIVITSSNPILQPAAEP